MFKTFGDLSENKRKAEYFDVWDTSTEIPHWWRVTN